MGRLTTLIGLLIASAGLLPPAAQAELDEIAMTQAEIQTFSCARYQQLFAADDLAFLIPEIRETLFQRLEERGPSDEQGTALGQLYDESRLSAVNAGMQAGSSEPSLDKTHLIILEHDAAVEVEVCLISKLELAQPIPERIDASMDDNMMVSWTNFVDLCGWIEGYATVLGLESLVQGMKPGTIANIRRHGASQGQIDQLLALYEEGRSRAEDLPVDWADEVRVDLELNEQLRRETETQARETFQLCTEGYRGN